MVQAGARIGLAVRWGASLSCLARFSEFAYRGPIASLLGGTSPRSCRDFNVLSVWTWCVLCTLTSKCASRHNGVHFFDISTSKKCSEHEVPLAFSLANVLRATTECNFSSLIWPAGSAPRRCSEPTFRPSGATNHGKDAVS